MLSFTSSFSWQNYLQAQLKFRICSNCSLQGRHLRAKLYCSAAKASCLSPSWLRTSRVGLVWLVPLLCPAPCDPSFERSLAGTGPGVPSSWTRLSDYIFFRILSRYRSSQDTEYSSLTTQQLLVPPGVHTAVRAYWPQTPDSPLPTPPCPLWYHKRVFYVCDSTSAL